MSVVAAAVAEASCASSSSKLYYVSEASQRSRFLLPSSQGKYSWTPPEAPRVLLQKAPRCSDHLVVVVAAVVVAFANYQQ